MFSSLSAGSNVLAAIDTLWTQLESNNRSKIPQGSDCVVWTFVSAVVWGAESDTILKHLFYINTLILYTLNL